MRGKREMSYQIFFSPAPLNTSTFTNEKGKSRQKNRIKNNKRKKNKPK